MINAQHFRALEDRYGAQPQSLFETEDITVSLGRTRMTLTPCTEVHSDRSDRTFFFQALSTASRIAVLSLLPGDAELTNYHLITAAPVPSGVVHVEGRVVARQGTLYIVEAVATDAEGQRLAYATGALARARGDEEEQAAEKVIAFPAGPVYGAAWMSPAGLVQLN